MRHTSPISGIASDGSHHIATAGYDNQVILWDARTCEPLAIGTHDHLANSCSFSPGGNLLASASSDYSVRVWSVPNMKLAGLFNGASDDIEMTVFHPKVDLLAAACRDGFIYVFTARGDLIAKLAGHQADVISVTWSDCCQFLFSSSDDGTVRKWCAQTWQLLETLRFGVETDTVVVTTQMAVIFGNDNGEIVCRDASGATETYPAHGSGIKRLVYDSRSNRIVSLSYDRQVKIWQLNEGTLKLIVSTEYPPCVWARSCAFVGASKLVFSTFGEKFATLMIDNQIWLTDQVGITNGVNSVIAVNGDQLTVGDSGIVSKNGERIGDLKSLCNFMVSAGTTVVTGGQVGALFNVETGDVIFRHSSPLNCAVMCGDGQLIVGAYSGEGILFEVQASEIKLKGIIKLQANAIKGLAYGNGSLVSVGASGEVKFHDIKDLRKTLVNKSHDKIANGVCFVRNGLFASVSRDLTLRLWTKESGEIVNTPHKNSIKCVTSDGHNLIATGSYAGQVAIYDTERRRWIHSGRPTAKGISSMAYCKVKKMFLASSYDGNVYEIQAEVSV